MAGIPGPIVLSMWSTPLIAVTFLVVLALSAWIMRRQSRLLVEQEHSPSLLERMERHRRRNGFLWVLCTVAFGLLAFGDLPDWLPVGLLDRSLLNFLSFLIFLVMVVVITQWADLPVSRTIIRDQRPFGLMVSENLRLLMAMGVFWMLLLWSPFLVSSVGEMLWWRAGIVALLLLLVSATYSRWFCGLLRCEPLPEGDLREAFEKLASSSKAPVPSILVFGDPRGSFRNAWALPAKGPGRVVFSRPLLGLLTPEESLGICAHELAHLEQFDRRLLRRLGVFQIFLIALATLGSAALTTLAPESLFPLPFLIWMLLFWAMRWKQRLFLGLETDGDLRALELCGNGEALISALTKLHDSMKLPRRMNSQVEARSTHPSLARRIQSIRNAMARNPSSTGTVEVPEAEKQGAYVFLSPKDPRHLLILEADALHALTLPEGDWCYPKSPIHRDVQLSLMGRSVEKRSYAAADLLDCRVEITGSGSRLHYRPKEGEGVHFALSSSDEGRIQEALLRLDSRLVPIEALSSAGHRPPSRWRVWLLGLLGLGLMGHSHLEPALGIWLLGAMLVTGFTRKPDLHGGFSILVLTLLGLCARQYTVFLDWRSQDLTYMAVILVLSLLHFGNVWKLASLQQEELRLFQNLRRPCLFYGLPWLICVVGAFLLGELPQGNEPWLWLPVAAGLGMVCSSTSRGLRRLALVGILILWTFLGLSSGPSVPYQAVPGWTVRESLERAPHLEIRNEAFPVIPIPGEFQRLQSSPEGTRFVLHGWRYPEPANPTDEAEADQAGNLEDYSLWLGSPGEVDLRPLPGVGVQFVNEEQLLVLDQDPETDRPNIRLLTGWAELKETWKVNLPKMGWISDVAIQVELDEKNGALLKWEVAINSQAGSWRIHCDDMTVLPPRVTQDSFPGSGWIHPILPDATLFLLDDEITASDWEDLDPLMGSRKKIILRRTGQEDLVWSPEKMGYPEVLVPSQPGLPVLLVTSSYDQTTFLTHDGSDGTFAGLWRTGEFVLAQDWDGRELVVHTEGHWVWMQGGQLHVTKAESTMGTTLASINRKGWLMGYHDETSLRLAQVHFDRSAGSR